MTQQLSIKTQQYMYIVDRVSSTVLDAVITVLPVPRFSRGIGLVLIRRCGKNLAVAGCDFLGYLCHPVWLFWASFWSDNKCKSTRQR